MCSIIFIELHVEKGMVKIAFGNQLIKLNIENRH